MTPAVALIPGFLGFGHDGGLTYFADRFIASVRAALEVRRGGNPIDVIPLSTLPTGSLADRQVRLLEYLKRLEIKLGARTWHLVGHSTGGLDAALLLRSEKLAFSRDKGTDFSKEQLAVPDIGSVVTIAAPHYGTGLATEVTVSHVFTALWDLVRSDALHSRFKFALAAANAGGSIPRMLFHDDLAQDLRPDVAGKLTATDNWRRDVPLFSIATCTPPPADNHPDPLFRDLWRWTDAGGRGAAAVTTMPAIGTIISSGRTTPAVDAGSNDGVVNTMRQVSGTLAGLVVGDHGDVIGRYQREDLVDGGFVDHGLLTSGARFGDAQFFALTRLVADCIHNAIEGRAPARTSC